MGEDSLKAVYVSDTMQNQKHAVGVNQNMQSGVKSSLYGAYDDCMSSFPNDMVSCSPGSNIDVLFELDVFGLAYCRHS